jgi:hypothetical protein
VIVKFSDRKFVNNKEAFYRIPWNRDLGKLQFAQAVKTARAKALNEAVCREF